MTPFEEAVAIMHHHEHITLEEADAILRPFANIIIEEEAFDAP